MSFNPIDMFGNKNICNQGLKHQMTTSMIAPMAIIVALVFSAFTGWIKLFAWWFIR